MVEENNAEYEGDIGKFSEELVVELASRDRCRTYRVVHLKDVRCLEFSDRAFTKAKKKGTRRR